MTIKSLKKSAIGAGINADYDAMNEAQKREAVAKMHKYAFQTATRENKNRNTELLAPEDIEESLYYLFNVPITTARNMKIIEQYRHGRTISELSFQYSITLNTAQNIVRPVTSQISFRRYRKNEILKMHNAGADAAEIAGEFDMEENAVRDIIKENRNGKTL